MERIYGIDILKNVAMLFIVILHILLNGCNIENIKISDNLYAAQMILWTIGSTAVNCYGISSGFVESMRNVNLKKIGNLYLCVWMYSCIPLVLLTLTSDLSIRYLVKSMFPVVMHQYWYISSYFLLIIFSPILNIAFERLTDEKLKKIAITLLIAVSITSIFQIDAFNFKNGYTGIWLIVLYIVGYTIKRTGIGKNIKTIYLFLIWIALILSGVFSNYMFLKYFPDMGYFTIPGDRLLLYTSPIMISASILMCMIFGRVGYGLRGTMSGDIIKKLSASTLAVYLLHENHGISALFIKGCFGFLNKLNPVEFVGAIFIISVLIFVIAMAIEHIRLQILKILKSTFVCFN